MTAPGFAPEKQRGSHQNEWLTPPHVLAALGEFDLDPCAPVVRPWPTAREHYHANGIERAWHGRVWLNPPYAAAGAWLAKLAAHGDGIAMVFARTDTAMFHRHVFGRAVGILFLRGRVKFCRPDGSTAGGRQAGAPSCLIAYGQHNAECLAACGLAGAFIPLTPSPAAPAPLFS